MSEKEIIYIGDPMCSWCWGFSPVLDQIRETYGAMAPVRVIVGGACTPSIASR